MARQAYGCDISEQGLPLSANDLIGLANRLVSEELATQNDPRFTCYLAITPKGQQIAEQEGGYLGNLQQLAQQMQETLRKESRAQINTWLTTLATVVSALIAAGALWVSISANNSLDKTNAQLEAQGKRLRALEAKFEQHQRP
jgi:hypothetical protein